ncbi:hypothetical protein MNBD_GAMMA24-563 [hydrothermal vent metagenome]|uniref:DUF2946 domain-containing protein n=1 Tax=hydrothermal vent metagenome TaxID=652676 RepID=A0A3B1C533_9ZZZZ
MHDDGMKKRLVHMLALSLLLVNIAWAADTCAEAVFGQFTGHSSVQSAEDNGPIKTIVDYDFCGHCAHASAHLVGLTQGGMLAEFNSVGDNFCTRLKFFYSRIQQPPTQPPKA